MRITRRPVLAVLGAVSLGGCALFSDFDGLSNGAADASSDGGADGSASDATSGGDANAGGDAGTDASPYRTAVLADGPIAYWPLDEAPGEIVAHEIVGGKNASFSGTVGFGAAGISGTGMEKTTENQVLEVGDYFDFAGKTAFTLEAWARPTLKNDYQAVFRKRAAGANGGLITYFRASDPLNPGFKMSQETTGASGRAVSVDVDPSFANAYHHVVVTYDPASTTSARVLLYVDGVRTSGSDDDLPAVDTAQVFWIGYGYTGFLDELAIYAKALDAERVLAHFQLGKK